MSQVNCPQCGRSVVFVAALSGQMVGCPGCNAHFVMKGPTESVEPPPMLRSSPTAAPGRTSSRSFRSHVSGAGLRPASSIFDVFDFTFEKYVTPLIIKITWSLAVLFSGLWLIAIVALCVITWIPSSQESSQPATASPPVLSPPRSRPPAREPIARPRTTSPRPSFDWAAWIDRKAVATVAYIQIAVAIVLILLWTRVVLETVIVVFHIATSIRSLDSKTPSIS